jgi:hypothetical protein
VENLKSVLVAYIMQTKPYWIIGGSCFAAGLILGVLL